MRGIDLGWERFVSSLVSSLICDLISAIRPADESYGLSFVVVTYC